MPVRPLFSPRGRGARLAGGPGGSGGGGGGGSSFSPYTVAGLELYLDSRFGLPTAVNGGTVSSWTDQSGNGWNGNVNNGSNFPTLATNATPNGTQAVNFTGLDFPNAQQIGSTVLSGSEAGRFGFSLYMCINGRAPASGGGGMLLVDQLKNMLWTPKNVKAAPLGTYAWQDRAGGGSAEGNSTMLYQQGWQTNRMIIQPGTFSTFWTGTGALFFNGTQLAMNSTFGNTYTLDGNTVGYTWSLGNLVANNVVGFNGQVAAVLCYKGAHDLPTQITVDNWMRRQFGLQQIGGG